ncbi:MAG: metallopeptidase TldD-related protein [Bacillota bacterium]
MVGKEGALALLEKVLSLSPGDATEVMLYGGDSYLTRYACNYIHQNVGEHNASLTVKIRFGQKVGQATTNRLDDPSLEEVIRQAVEIARVQPDNPELPPVPEPQPVPAVDAFVPATARFSPIDRARGAREVIEIARAMGFEAAGAFSTTAAEVAVANSRGIRAYHAGTMAIMTAVVMSPDSAGFALGASTDVAGIDPRAIGQRAAQKCRDGRNSIRLDPGEYEVVLEPLAVADLVEYIGRLGFSAEAYQEGRSFVCGKLGQQIVHPSVTIWDDGLDARGIPLPFDAEGVPKQKVVLVDQGKANALVYDSRTAHREGKTSTGHAVAWGWWSGPVPTNLFMAPGDASLEDMIRSTRRGILVTRFHYTNPVHPARGIITGMTRDGTFLIDNGEIRAPIKNFRFTQGLLEAFSAVEAIGRDLVLVSEGFGSATVPAVKLSRFNFTGVTEF